MNFYLKFKEGSVFADIHASRLISIARMLSLLKPNLNKHIIMRINLTAAVLIAMFMQVSANGFAQRVSLQETNASLKNLFHQLKEQAGVDFVYNPQMLNEAKTVSVYLENATVDEALAQIFRNQPLTYTLDQNVIIVKRKEKLAEPLSSVTQQQTVTGKVTDGAGEGLPGVTVQIKGTQMATSTDGQGNFSIQANSGDVLVFTMMGFKRVERTVSSPGAINVQMEEDMNVLQDVEVVSTGYQQIDRKLFTGSASTLKAEDVQRNGIPDISRMLEGQVAGVSVQNVSGTFGAAPKIRIRGATSISGDNKPLWVVDGIILEDVVNISNEQLSTGDPSTLIGSSVAGINPNDIESFSILKDAAATALYGARAMNGVIVVTTKKGRMSDGKPLISYSGNFTTYLKPRYSEFDILNSADQMALFIDLENKGYFNHSAISRAREGGVFYKMYNLMYDYDEASDTYALRNDMESRINFLNRYANVNTDWFDLLFKNSLLQEHSLSVSSGTEKSRIYASTSFLKDNGWTIADNVKRFTGNLRGNFKLNDKLSIELISTASVRDQETPGSLGREMDAVTGRYSRNFDINPFSYSLNTSRTLTPYDENGNREFFTKNWAPFNIFHELENNSMALSMLDFKMQGGMRYNIVKGLTYSFDGAYRYAKTDREHLVHESSNMAEAYRAALDATIRGANEFLYDNPDFPNDLEEIVLPEGGFYNTASDGIVNYYLRNTIEFDRQFNEDHLFNFFGSAEIRYSDRQSKTMEGIGYQYERGGVPSIDPDFIKWRVESSKPYYTMQRYYDRFVAYMGRAAYSYNEKYAVNATVRYDGSNLMGDEPTARWLPTWNISGAWNIDQEPFFQHQNITNVLSAARIRATYGLVGSLGAANNSSIVLMNQQTRRPYLNEVETALIVDALKNSELTWEKLYETNLGVDLGFLDNRIDLTVDVYRRKIFDLIGAFRTSGIGGQYTKMANYGDMKGQGLEVTLGAEITEDRPLKWRTQLNFAHNTSEITKLDNNPNIWDLIRQDGGPKEGHPQRGLFSINFEDLDAEYGVPYFINQDGERSVDVYYQNTTGVAHLVYEGPIDPTFTGGWYNQLRYKDFSLSFLFTFAAGNVIRLDPGFDINPTDMYAMTEDYLRRWVMTGDQIITTIPATIDGTTEDSQVTGYPYNAFNYSTERVAKGDFVRFKQIAFNYQLPQKWVNNIGFRSASLGVIGNNLALIYSDKRLNGQDPEFFGSGGVALPIPRQFTLNLKLGF